MYSKNEVIVDFKKNTKWRKKKKVCFFFQKIEPGDFFFQNVETDQSASRVPIQPV